MPHSVLFFSTVSGHVNQDHHTQKFDDWLLIHKIKVEKIDASNQENEEIRNKLWEVSNTKAEKDYPLLFIKEDDDSYTFVGNYDTIFEYIENDLFHEKFVTCECGEDEERVINFLIEEVEPEDDEEDGFNELPFRVIVDTIHSDPDKVNLSDEEKKTVFETITQNCSSELQKDALRSGYFNANAIASDNFDFVKQLDNETLTNNNRINMNEKYGEDHQEEIDQLFPKLISKVIIIKGVDLRICDNNGLSDPYLTVLDTNFKSLYKTKTIKKNLNPEWNEEFEFDYYKETKLHFRVEDKDFLVDDVEGITHLNVGDEVFVKDKEYKFKLHITEDDRKNDIKKFGDEYDPENSIVIRFE